MKKLFAQGLLAFPIWLMLGSISFAMCIWFVPPARQFAPATNIKTLLSRHDDQLEMVVQPQFSGNATEFGLVMPFPSQPELAEAPEDLFTELEDLTNPLVEAFQPGVAFLEEDSAVSGRSGVEVLEQRDVGDYSATTLSATSGDDLNTWLAENGFEMTPDKQAIVDQYVDEAGFFVALKVNMGTAQVDEQGFLTGELRPISFTFESESTTLPLRLMAGETSLVTLTVYSLADELTYIPGAALQYSKKVSNQTISENASLEQFDAWQQWLTRNVVQFEPQDVTADLELKTTTDTVVVVPGEVPLVLNPDQITPETGVIEASGTIIYTDEDNDESSQSVTSESSDTAQNVLIGLLAISNVVLLFFLIYTNRQKAAK